VLRGQLAQGSKDPIFVGDLKVKPAVSEQAKKNGRESELKQITDSLDTQFVSALSATRVFDLVDRKRLPDIQREQGFAAVAVDPNDKNAAKMLQMAGAKFAFLPEIDGFQDASASEQFQSIGRSYMKRRIVLSAMVQIVDTTTGKLLPDVPAETVTFQETLELTQGASLTSDEALVKVAKTMAQKLCAKVVNNLRPAKVLTITGTTVMINRGSEAGFETGCMLEFYATQDVKDEDTGEVFRNEVSMGKGKIVRGDNRQSFAEIVGQDLGIAKNCVARIIAAPSSGGSAAVGPSASTPETRPESSVISGSSEKLPK
jgi:curli biogenesis system outer membrane secretion channel CsgG